MSLARNTNSVGGQLVSEDLPGKWQFRADSAGLVGGGKPANKKIRSFLSLSTCVLSPRISGGLAECQQGPRPQVARRDHESSAPPSWTAEQPISVLRQSLRGCTSREVSRKEGELCRKPTKLADLRLEGRAPAPSPTLLSPSSTT